MLIGDSIKKIRLRRGFSQEKLSSLSGLAQNVISRIERNMHKPTGQTLTALATALEVEEEVFYYYALTDPSKTSEISSLLSKLSSSLNSEIEELFGLEGEE